MKPARKVQTLVVGEDNFSKVTQGKIWHSMSFMKGFVPVQINLIVDLSYK